MRDRFGRPVPLHIWLIIAVVLVGCLQFGGGHLFGRWLSTEIGVFLFILSLLMLGYGHVRFVSALASRTDIVIAAIRGIGEGTEGGFKRWSSDATMGSLGDELRVAVVEFAASVDSLRRDKRRSEMVISNIADGIIAIDCDGRISLLNKAASAILGDKAAQLVGQKIENADVHPEMIRLTYECIATKTDLAAEITIPGYQKRVMSIRAIPYRGVGTELDCAVITLHDVTELRQTESSQRQFVGNVSHELKTPLTAIRTTAETLLEGAKHDEDVVDQFLNNIITETDRLSFLIEGIMQLARIDSGVVLSSKKEINVSELVNRAVNAVLPQAQAGGVEVVIDVDKDSTFYCDEVQMIQLIRNLADNAVKYTQSGGRVDISVHPELVEHPDPELDSGLSKDEGHPDPELKYRHPELDSGPVPCNLSPVTCPYMVIRVVDTGIGIPQGEIHRIFERFYRVDKARSNRMGGTGLGLAIVKEIVDAHLGTIDVETQLGVGSTFTVVLPRRSGQISSP